MLVDRSLLGDEGIHIRDADHDLHIAIGSAFGDFNLIQIARSVVVDGGPEQVAKIANIAAAAIVADLLSAGELVGDRRRKIGMEAVLLHDCFAVACRSRCEGLASGMDSPGEMALKAITTPIAGAAKHTPDRHSHENAYRLISALVYTRAATRL